MCYPRPTTGSSADGYDGFTQISSGGFSLLWQLGRAWLDRRRPPRGPVPAEAARETALAAREADK